MPKQIDKRKAIALLNKAEKLKKVERHRAEIIRGPGSGDRLASGAPSATFRMPSVDQREWDRAFMSDEEFEATYGKKARRKKT